MSESKAEFDVAQIKRDFPALNQEINGQPLVYLDSAATTQKPEQVLEAEAHYLRTTNAAVHRGAHTLASNATDMFEDSREQVARFIGAGANETIWTSGATAALNIVAYGFANANAGLGTKAAERYLLNPGDEIVFTEAEHHANLIPWQQLAAKTGAKTRAIPVHDDGTLNMDAAAEIIGPNTKVLAITHVSNVLGIINPVADLVELAKKHGAITVLDACQSAPNMALNLHDLGVDFAAMSGHKMLGPNGIGLLYGRYEMLDALPPVLTGGSMVTTVTLEEAGFLPPPQKFEAGTQPVSQTVGFAEATRYLERIGMKQIAAHESALSQQLLAGLRAIPGVRIIGDAPDAPRVGLVSVEVEGVHAHDVGQFLDSRGIAVRVGHHCAKPLHARFGVSASVRASGALYNTSDDIEQYLATLGEVRDYFGVTL